MFQQYSLLWARPPGTHLSYLVSVRLITSILNTPFNLSYYSVWYRDSWKNVPDRRHVMHCIYEALYFQTQQTAELGGKHSQLSSAKCHLTYIQMLRYSGNWMLNILVEPEKIYRWQISIWTDVPHHMSSGKCRLKQQWDTTTHLLEWPQSGTPIPPNAREDVEQWELSFIASGKAKWFSRFGRHSSSFSQN